MIFPRNQKKKRGDTSVKRKSSHNPEVEWPKGRRDIIFSDRSSEKIAADRTLNLTRIGQNINIVVNQNLPGPNPVAPCTFQSMVPAVRSDKFAHEFCEWYYNMVNRLQSCCCHLPGDTFSEDIFFQNSSADMYLIGKTTVERHVQGQHNIYRLLRDTFNEFGLLFSPNLSGGIQAQKSSHGMVKIFCCGTLNCNDLFVGIFEQEFGLVYSPADRKWKITYIKVNLKQSENRPELPSLPPCQLFDIPTSS